MCQKGHSGVLLEDNMRATQSRTSAYGKNSFNGSSGAGSTVMAARPTFPVVFCGQDVGRCMVIADSNHPVAGRGQGREPIESNPTMGIPKIGMPGMGKAAAHVL
jgi:hypothetical protein